MAINFRRFFSGINVVPKTSSTVSAAGDLDFDTTNNKLNLHNGTIASPVVTEAGTATLTNKSIDADNNTITNIDNNDIKAAAAIALNKLAATTANRALVSDGSGFIAPSTTTTTQLQQLSTSQTANTVLAAPDGAPGVPSFRALTAGDLPAGTGSVTSVALADSTGTFNITGSPVTNSGTLTLSSYQSQSANRFLASPNGAPGAPTFRAIVAADVPTLNQNTTGTASNVTGIVAVANGGTGLSTLSSGNVILGNGSSSPTFVAPGTSGNVLTSTGSTWVSAPASGGSSSNAPNLIINGGMDIWQRNSSSITIPTSAYNYTADRWGVKNNTDASVLASKISPLGSDIAEDTGYYSALGTAFNNNVFSAEFQSTQKLILGGQFTSFNGTGANRLIRLNSGGSIDTSFLTNIGTGVGSGAVQTIKIQQNDKIVVVGQFTSFNGNTTLNTLFRLNADGTEDTTFSTNIGTGGDSQISDIGFLSDGSIILGGDFLNFNGNSAGYICKLDSNGNFDSTFNTNIGTGFNNPVDRIRIFSDDTIAVGGQFTSFNGSSLNRLAKLNADGSPNTTFNTNIGTACGAGLTSMDIDSSDNLIISYGSTTFNGNTTGRVTKLSSTGTFNSAFNTNIGSGLNVSAQYIKVDQNDNIFLGGSFSSFNGNTRNAAVRLNSNGTEESTFTTALGSGFNSGVYGIGLNPMTSDVIMVGLFTSFNGNTRNYIVKFFTAIAGSSDSNQLKVIFDTGATTGDFEIWQPLESLTSLYLLNNDASFSTYIKAAANVTQVGLQFLYDSTFTEIVPNTPIGSEVLVTVNNATDTLCQINAQAIGTAPFGGSKSCIGIRIRPTAVSSGNIWDSDNGLYINRACLTQSSVASLYMGQETGETVSQCQRFTSKSYNLFENVNTTPTDGYAMMTVAPNTNGYGSIEFPVSMRVAPSVTFYNHSSSAGPNTAFNVSSNSNITSITAAGVNENRISASIAITPAPSTGQLLLMMYFADAEIY